ncbi:MAG: chemotaxis protein CheB [Verrucomicrobia bacterium]|nr:chemotaxis protein CheB [Verrucomicrobiota bacterium]
MAVPPCTPALSVIAMAASAGGLNALSVILGGLPADFPAAIAIVMHLSPVHKSLLAEILSSRSQLEVRQAQTGDILCHSSVFVAPPNHHMSVVKGGRIALSSDEAEKVYFGVQIIKDRGGRVIAQDRPTSQDFSMPQTSIATGDVDFILPLTEIAPMLIELIVPREA